MASSFSLTSHSYGGRYLYLECSQAKDATTNKSTISWKLSSIGGSSNYYSTSVTITIGGTTVYQSGKVEWNTYKFPAAKGSTSGTTTVSHDGEGKKTINVVMTAMIYDGVSKTVSGSWILDDIPRASAFSTITGSTIGSAVTVNITRASSSFTHQLWYKVGNSAWYDLGKGIGTSKTFTIDIATASQITTSMSGNMQLCLRTFNGTTQIGSDVYKDVTVYVPDYTPTITNILLTGNNLRDGAYVQSKSAVKVNITASTLYGATIKTYSSKVDGKTYTGATFTSSVLSNGSKSVSVTITDTRGKTATLTSANFTVYEYAPPSITEFRLERFNDGTDVVAYVMGEVSPIGNKNTKTLSVTLHGITKNILVAEYSIDHMITFTGIPTDQTLTATVTIADYYTSIKKDAVLPTVAVTMDFHHSGKGAAFGKVAEHENLLDIAWDIKYKGDIINDVVIEQGINGIWTYRKWKSGIAECWGTRIIENVKVDKTWGSLYYAEPPESIQYPLTFINKPIETVMMSSDGMWTWYAAASINTTMYTGKYLIMRPDSASTTAYTVYLHYQVRGQWK